MQKVTDYINANKDVVNIPDEDVEEFAEIITGKNPKKELVSKAKEDMTIGTFVEFIEFYVNKLGIKDNINNIRNWKPNEYTKFIEALDKIINKAKNCVSIFWTRQGGSVYVRKF